VTFEAGQELFHQGDMSDAAYIIIDGSADVVLDTQGGRVTIATIGRNELVGEIGIICDAPRIATVQAKSRLVTLKVSKDLLLRMITDFPTMAIEIMRSLAHRLEHTNAQLREAVAQH
jgi:CRP-like cAMP-binding protein